MNEPDSINLRDKTTLETVGELSFKEGVLVATYDYISKPFLITNNASLRMILKSTLIEIKEDR